MVRPLAVGKDEERPAVVVMRHVVGEGAPHVRIGAVHRHLQPILAALVERQRHLPVARREDPGHRVERRRLRHQHDMPGAQGLRVVDRDVRHVLARAGRRVDVEQVRPRLRLQVGEAAAPRRQPGRGGEARQRQPGLGAAVVDRIAGADAIGAGIIGAGGAGRQEDGQRDAQGQEQGFRDARHALLVPSL